MRGSLRRCSIGKSSHPQPSPGTSVGTSWLSAVTHLRKIVTTKVRDLRQNRNRDDLVHSQLKAYKGPSKILDAPGVVSGRESDGGSDSEGPVRSPALPAPPISSGGEGEREGKRECRQAVLSFPEWHMP
jgi:hypothetical protein